LPYLAIHAKRDDKDIRVGMRRYKKMYSLFKNDKIENDLL